MKFKTGFSVNPVWLKVSPEFSSAESRVYAELLRIVGTNEYAWASIHYIASELRLAPRTVRSAVRFFEREKLVKVEHRHGKSSRYWLLEHVWQLRDREWAAKESKALRRAAHERATLASEQRAKAREEANPSPWKTTAHPGSSDPGVQRADLGINCRGTTFPTPAIPSGLTPAIPSGLTPAKSADNEENNSEENVFEERREILSPTSTSATVEKASEAARATSFDRPSPTDRLRPTDASTAAATDRLRPSPGSASPSPVPFRPPVLTVVPSLEEPPLVDPLDAKIAMATAQRRWKAIAEVEKVWREEMAKHFPQVRLGATQWTPKKMGEPKNGEAKNVLDLFDDYGLELTVTYVRWVISNWPTIAKRYEKSGNITATPTTIQAQWKVKDLMPEAQGVAGATAAQQVRSLKDRIKAWQREHPGELLPKDLAREAYLAPKLKGDKV